ncbi:MAG: Nucleoside-diphosphate-sugar epimerases [uncultured Segetibacter sp.]|uniref:Nucleoside-diphosphate-sugar epimerases n=1 Tax=uncultured Segetibacter sp. TaxID=481133 RepID=A0A6J4SEH1_9BACT|nr:MAG: Nucleoside-diphosphate-sugar epimerases [uncultured Segetibacter sp.]
MQIIVTGGAGFLGQRLAKALLKSNVAFKELILADIVMPLNPVNDGRVTCLQVDLSKEDAAKKLVTSKTAIVFHLAAVVSSHAEKDFDIGYKVNLDITRLLLEACRHQNPDIKFIFSSSLAVYGGKLPAVVNDTTAVTPRSSYGTQKAMGELLVNDYSRKKFVDGRVLRLPTICVRPGRPNLAASSFVSSIIREPLNGEQAICPVSPDLTLWLSSPDTIIENLMKGAVLDAGAFDGWRTVNLPGIGVTVKEMLASLQKIAGKTTVDKVEFIPDAAINNIVSSWPGAIDNTLALQLDFKVDNNFDDFITQFLKNNKQ